MCLKFEKFIISQKAIIIRDEKCLILEFSSKPGFWDVPGGRIHKGEDADLAFKREVREEVGLNNIQYPKIYSRKNFNYFSKKMEKMISVCALFFIIQDKKRKEIILSEEHLQYKWISEDEIKDYKFYWAFMSEVIRDGFKKLK